jgi:hypothetical protein
MLKADFRKLVLTHLTVIDGTEDTRQTIASLAAA